MNCMSYLRFLFWLEYQDCIARKWSYFNLLSQKSKNSWLKLEMVTHDHNSIQNKMQTLPRRCSLPIFLNANFWQIYSFGFAFDEKCGKFPPNQGLLLLHACIHCL